MLFQKPSLRTRVTFEAGMAQLGGHAIYLTHDVVLGARESVRDVARNLERFVDGIVVRTGPHEVARGARGAGRHPGHQRPDRCASIRARRWPTCSRMHERFGASTGSSWPSSATATTSTTRWRCSAPRSGWRSAWRIPRGYAPNARIVARASELAAGSGATRPSATIRTSAVRGADRRLHRCLDVDGPGGRDRGAARRVRRLPRRRRAARRGRPPTSSRCTACRPTAARRSPRRSWTGRAA